MLERKLVKTNEIYWLSAITYLERGDALLDAQHWAARPGAHLNLLSCTLTISQRMAVSPHLPPKHPRALWNGPDAAVCRKMKRPWT